jgi:hypothetical protein
MKRCPQCNRIETDARNLKNETYQVMYLTPESEARKDDQRDRYLFLSKESKAK